ncbi:LUD domain-containing protein [Ktedonosporobacter rubrisoli]|nr:LUD domain-containing protein [Ktedonosporobacter rubrisoli]
MTSNLSPSIFTHLASGQQIEKTVKALHAHGIRVVVCETGEQASKCVLELIPNGATVYDLPSRTLEMIGLSEQIERATRFQSVRVQAAALDHTTKRNKIRKLIAAPDVLVGSVHAVTEAGEVLIASASGSQLSAAACGASKVIWVVGTQKLVGTLEDGLGRIRDYCLPLESERMQRAYGQLSAVSAINKLLTITAEHKPGRITTVLVKQQLGF